MTEQDDIRNPKARPHEAAPAERRATKVHTWTGTLAIAGALLAVMYGVTTHRAVQQREIHQAEVRQDMTIQAPAGLDTHPPT